MNAASPLDNSLPPPLALWIDQACDRFEKALRQGQRPQIEQFIADAPEDARAMLIHELVAVELAWGKGTSLQDYRQRFPKHAALLTGLFTGNPAPKVSALVPSARVHRTDAPVAPAAPIAQPVPNLRHPSPLRKWLVFAAIAGTLLLFGALAVALVSWGGARPKPLPANELAGKRFTNGLGMEFALIPGGKFTMGSPITERDRNPTEGPEHEVALTQPYFLGVHEVTVAQFRAFIEKSSYRSEAETGGRGAFAYDGATKTFEMNPARTWRSPGWAQGDRDPVVCVSWNDARAFCEWLSQQEKRTYRLPTEAEWECACRAGTTTPFSIGPSLSSFQANFNGERPYGDGARSPYRQRPVAIGTFAANPYGLHDMHGNVTEWCADWHDIYAAEPQTNPTGPSVGQDRVYRGGSWFDHGNLCRSAIRGKNRPDTALTVVGFRVVCMP
ncbi:MAG: formylglycine-generating enzyme family protein [Gemmataceae bacterium]|nr:formylglycine-generating enzyme family protein [Gemmataceae bacterium]